MKQVRTAIIADDSKLSRQSARRILESIGFKIVAEAVDGSDIIDLYEQLKPDIVILDILMPNVKGSDILKELMDRNPKANVIVVSGLGVFEQDVLQKGAKKFIQKPVDIAHLISVIEELLGKKE